MNEKFFFIPLLIISLSCSKQILIQKSDSEIASLIKTYKSDNWEKRLSALTEIASLNSELAESILLHAADDPHPSVRIVAIKSLKKYNSTKVKLKIGQIARYDSNDNVKWWAIKTLSYYRDPLMAPVFVKALDNKDYLIREEAIKGLIDIDDFAIKYISIPYFLEAIRDKNISVRLAVLNNLKIKDERLYNELKKILQEKDIINQPTFLKAILKALYGYKIDREVKNILIHNLTHNNTEIRVLSFRVIKKDYEMRKAEKIPLDY